MNEPTEWTWDEPTDVGWYAITYSYDAEEGMFPGAAKWDGEKWESSRPIVGCAGPFIGEDAATEWAIAHEVEGNP